MRKRPTPDALFIRVDNLNCMFPPYKWSPKDGFPALPGEKKRRDRAACKRGPRAYCRDDQRLEGTRAAQEQGAFE